MKYHIFSTFTLVLGLFFTDPNADFSGSDPDIWPIRIRTQKKSLIRIRKKTWIRNTAKMYADPVIITLLVLKTIGVVFRIALKL